MAAVLGGWGTIVMLFSVTSALGLSATRRSGEIGLLRTLGASPRQARRLIGLEALAVAVTGAVAGAAIATGTGRLLLGLLRGRIVAA